MMNKNKDTAENKKISFSFLMSNNKFVFLISLVIAIVFWTFVSASQTTEIEKVFTNIKVNINIDESVAKNNGLDMFGQQDYFVDVTVKGFSYIINSDSFNSSNINVTASCAAVAAAGTYDLPLTAAIVGNNTGNVEVVNVSASNIKVTFDEKITKTFAVNEEVKELDGYELEEGFIRENPRLSVNSIDISGPSREISKITNVKAYIEIDKKLTATESFEANIIAESSNGVIDLTNCTIELSEPVYVTIPVCKVGTYETAVDFIGIPQAYRSEGIEYSVYPSQIDISVQTGPGEAQLDDNNKILIGTIDFCDINNTVNKIVVENANISSEIKNFTVTIDMSSMSKRWLGLPVDMTSVEVPEGVTVLSTVVESVQIVGPASSVMNIDKTSAYAVPVFDNVDLTPGIHQIPAKIVLRTLTDSWVHGTYTIEIEVK